MNIKEYLKLSEVTERKFPQGLHLNQVQAETLHHAMGVCTEAGELMDQLKRHIIYGFDLDATNLIEELGDLSWYMAGIMRTINRTRSGEPHNPEIASEIMDKNIAKLRKRFKEKFNTHEALNRDLDKERSVLEQDFTKEDAIREDEEADFINQKSKPYGLEE